MFANKPSMALCVANGHSLLKEFSLLSFAALPGSAMASPQHCKFYFTFFFTATHQKHHVKSHGKTWLSSVIHAFLLTASL